MKPFKEYIVEYYDHSDSQIPQEIHDANDHLVDLVTLDSDLRKKHGIAGNPLMYDMRSLTNIHELYLGTRHPDQYPEYAKNKSTYIRELHKEYPHLAGHFVPPERGQTKSWQ